MFHPSCTLIGIHTIQKGLTSTVQTFSNTPLGHHRNSYLWKNGYNCKDPSHLESHSKGKEGSNHIVYRAISLRRTSVGCWHVIGMLQCSTLWLYTHVTMVQVGSNVWNVTGSIYHNVIVPLWVHGKGSRCLPSWSPAKNSLMPTIPLRLTWVYSELLQLPAFMIWPAPQTEDRALLLVKIYGLSQNSVKVM